MAPQRLSATPDSYYKSWCTRKVCLCAVYRGLVAPGSALVSESVEGRVYVSPSVVTAAQTFST